MPVGCLEYPLAEGGNQPDCQVNQYRHKQALLLQRGSALVDCMILCHRWIVLQRYPIPRESACLSRRIAVTLPEGCSLALSPGLFLAQAIMPLASASG